MGAVQRVLNARLDTIRGLILLTRYSYSLIESIRTWGESVLADLGTVDSCLIDTLY